MFKWPAHRSSNSAGTVICQLSSSHCKQVKENQEYLSQLINILLFLSCQGIPLRDRFEDKNSFFKYVI